MKTYAFRVVVEPDDGRWHAFCPALEERGAATWGHTREEALRSIQQVVEMVVQALVEDGEPVPEVPPKTLRSMVEVQAKWREEDLRRLGLM